MYFYAGLASLMYMASEKVMTTRKLRALRAWCVMKDQRALRAGDFNGDGFTDLVCHYRTGQLMVLVNQKDPKQMKRESQTVFCGHVLFG